MKCINTYELSPHGVTSIAILDAVPIELVVPTLEMSATEMKGYITIGKHTNLKK